MGQQVGTRIAEQERKGVDRRVGWLGHLAGERHASEQDLRVATRDHANPKGPLDPDVTRLDTPRLCLFA